MSVQRDIRTHIAEQIQALTPATKASHKDSYRFFDGDIGDEIASAPESARRLFSIDWGEIRVTYRPVTRGVPIIFDSELVVSIIYPYSSQVAKGQSIPADTQEDAAQIIEALELQPNYEVSARGIVYSQLFDSQIISVLAENGVYVSSLTFVISYSVIPVT